MHTITTTRPCTCSKRTSSPNRLSHGVSLRYPEMHWRFTKLQSASEYVSKASRTAVEDEPQTTSRCDDLYKQLDHPFNLSTLSDSGQHDPKAEALREMQLIASSFPEQNDPEKSANLTSAFKHHRPPIDTIGDPVLNCVRTVFKRMGHKVVEKQVAIPERTMADPIDPSDSPCTQGIDLAKVEAGNYLEPSPLTLKRAWGDCEVLIADSSIKSVNICSNTAPSPVRALRSGNGRRVLSPPNASKPRSKFEENTQTTTTRRARYGPWYVPQGQWWQLYSAQGKLQLQTDFDAAIDTVDALPTIKVPEFHQQNQRKLARLKAEVPATYIGREYRSHIVARGLVLPAYLRS
uniref:AlNc14C70G4838 protein n=1 Tax=Albugo laibachii Nc14 TaxID=890382 RepID=F0WDW9_9STRA|nr:AlNc14C70G4838 [Albugo laibachii Nc14]|eukprot:CCA19397.1 AlNc14C70G4838 [Albugo laibachii Nc14]